MSELFIMLTLWLSSSWVFSNWRAPTYAWRNGYLQAFAGLLFVASWLANTFDVVTNTSTKELINATPMDVFIAVLVVVGAYAVSIKAFVMLRIHIARYKGEA